MTTTDEPVDMWRLRLSKGNGQSGGGEWSYHEDRASLEMDLFQAAMEFESHRSDGRTQEATRRRARWNLWRRAQGGEDLTGKYHVTRIVAVEHLVDSRWVEVSWSIAAPELTLELTDA